MTKQTKQTKYLNDIRDSLISINNNSVGISREFNLILMFILIELLIIFLAIVVIGVKL